MVIITALALEPCRALPSPTPEPGAAIGKVRAFLPGRQTCVTRRAQGLSVARVLKRVEALQKLNGVTHRLPKPVSYLLSKGKTGV